MTIANPLFLVQAQKSVRKIGIVSVRVYAYVTAFLDIGMYVARYCVLCQVIKSVKIPLLCDFE